MDVGNFLIKFMTSTRLSFDTLFTAALFPRVSLGGVLRTTLFTKALDIRPSDILNERLKILYKLLYGLYQHYLALQENDIYD